MSQPDSTRLEALSDAVFAFAATLLVVSLEVPSTYAALVAELPGFGSFAISFGALLAIWTVHRAFFRRYRLGDGVTVFLNSTLLFLLLFYVYPLKFMARGMVSMLPGLGQGGPGTVATWDELGQLFALYSVGFAAIFACVSLMYRYAWRRRVVLGLSADQAREALFLHRHYLLFVAVGAASVVAALTGVGLRIGFPGWLYAALGPLCWYHGRRSARGGS